MIYQSIYPANNLASFAALTISAAQPGPGRKVGFANDDLRVDVTIKVLPVEFVPI